MVKHTFSRDDIEQLCKRLESRGTSRLLQDQPELQTDLRVAAYILRRALDIGFPVRPIEFDDIDGHRSVS